MRSSRLVPVVVLLAACVRNPPRPPAAPEPPAASRYLRRIADEFFRAGVKARYDEQHAIGKRYARHDEVGTPYCLTVDSQTSEDETVTIRYRDSRRQERIKVAEALSVVQKALASSEGPNPG